MTDESSLVGPIDAPASPEIECAACGAAYYGRGAAVECCSDRFRTETQEEA